MSDQSIDYIAISRRIAERCQLLHVDDIDGISTDRMSRLRKDATDISALEVTQISRGLHCSIPHLIFGK